MINLHEGEGDSGAENFSGEGQLLKLTLIIEGSEPPVWRQLVLKDTLWLSDLHDAIQVAFGWYDYQTHIFRIGKTAYGNPYKREECLVEDDRNLTLDELDLPRSAPWYYDYHMGEGWMVEIRAERVPSDSGEFGESPVCVAGERAGPPEDCGGIEAFHDMLECIKEPYSESGREWLEWLDEGYDPEKCDFETINKALSEIAKPPEEE